MYRPASTWRAFFQQLLQCLEHPIPDVMLIADALDGCHTVKGSIEETYSVFTVGPKLGTLGIILCSKSDSTSFAATDSESEGEMFTKSVGPSFKVTAVEANEDFIQLTWQCKSSLFSPYWSAMLACCLEHGKELFTVNIPSDGQGKLERWNPRAAEAFLKRSGCKSTFMAVLITALKQVAEKADCRTELVETTKRCVSGTDGALFSFKKLLAGKATPKAKPAVKAKGLAKHAKLRTNTTKVAKMA